MREVVFLVVILLVLLFAFEFFSFLSKLSTSKQLLQKSILFEQGGFDKEVSILVIGDSLGVGVGAAQAAITTPTIRAQLTCSLLLFSL